MTVGSLERKTLLTAVLAEYVAPAPPDRSVPGMQSACRACASAPRGLSLVAWFTGRVTIAAMAFKTETKSVSMEAAAAPKSVRWVIHAPLMLAAPLGTATPPRCVALLCLPLCTATTE